MISLFSIHRDQRGLTLVELLVAALIASLVGTGAVVITRSAATTGGTGAGAAASVASNIAVGRITQELGSAITVVDARPDYVTVVVSPTGSANPASYRDPISGREVQLQRYTVRYLFRDGALYRDTGQAPAFAQYRAPSVNRPIVPLNTTPPSRPNMPFPSQLQRPTPPQPVSDPGPVRYVRVYQGRSWEFVFSGYLLPNGLVTTRLWTGETERCRRIGRGEYECSPRTTYHAAGPPWIDTGTYYSILNNPVRNSDGSIVGYRISSEVFAYPSGMSYIGSRPYYAWWGPWAYYVMNWGNRIDSYWYYYAQSHPVTIYRFIDNYQTVVDPNWQAQYNAYQRYQQELAAYRVAYQNYVQRYNEAYNAWTNYYREYGRWQDRLTTDMAIQQIIDTGSLMAASRKNPGSPWRAASTVGLSGQAQVIARVTGSFSYTDASGNPTWDPARVRMIHISYATPDGRTASTGVPVGGTGASAQVSKNIQKPDRCQVDPSVCAPKPPRGDPTESAYPSSGRRIYTGQICSESGCRDYTYDPYNPDPNQRWIWDYRYPDPAAVIDSRRHREGPFSDWTIEIRRRDGTVEIKNIP